MYRLDGAARTKVRWDEFVTVRVSFSLVFIVVTHSRSKAMRSLGFTVSEGARSGSRVLFHAPPKFRSLQGPIHKVRHCRLLSFTC